MLVNINNCFTRMSRYNDQESFDCANTSQRPCGSKYNDMVGSIIKAEHPELDKLVNLTITMWIDSCMLFNYSKQQTLEVLRSSIKLILKSTKFDYWGITPNWVVVVGSDDYICYQHRIDMNNNLMRSLKWLR